LSRPNRIGLAVSLKSFSILEHPNLNEVKCTILNAVDKIQENFESYLEYSLIILSVTNNSMIGRIKI
jgi:hypothetical protein